MEQSVKEFMEKLLNRLQKIEYVNPQEIPNIDLYMDQVTSFMDEQLAGSKRHNDDKLLTKTMINNYTKNNLLPPPEKKKYSKEHMLTLIFIYYFKNILSIGDIHTLLEPLTGKYFQNKFGPDMTEVYEEIFKLEKAESEKELKDLAKKYAIAKESFADFPEEDQEYLRQFSFVCLLSYDIYIKKMIIESLIDDLAKK